MLLTTMLQAASTFNQKSGIISLDEPMQMRGLILFPEDC